MEKLFLDPDQTLGTCKESSCVTCPVSNKLVCHFNGKQLFMWFLLCIPIFVSGGYFIYTQNPFFLIPWGIFIISFFGLIEIRVMCSHCPHYAEKEINSLKCWANYGAPKLWKYRPGPMSIIEKIVFFSGLLIISLPPAVILFIQKNYFLLLLYVIFLIVWKLAIGKFYCKKCINFACPLNAVDNATKTAFFDKNKVVKDAWLQQGK